MTICITASRIMKASEVRKHCRQLKDNETLRNALELSIKEKILKLKKGQAVLTA